MNDKLFPAVLITVFLTAATAVLITAAVFDSPFADSTVDYFSFFAAAFLVADGLYKIFRYRSEAYFPLQLSRHARIIIGACIFTIHMMQFLRK